MLWAGVTSALSNASLVFDRGYFSSFRSSPFSARLSFLISTFRFFDFFFSAPTSDPVTT